ncbi:hypothetical protein P4313_16565 [Bacillus tropicus]|nr:MULTISPECIES: hypothetical protein [Bacillus cereus group]MED3036639.1 hypothetical protein [Bacillus tropicus]
MLSNLKCPECGERLWVYNHTETISIECNLLECDFEREIDLEEIISDN